MLSASAHNDDVPRQRFRDFWLLLPILIFALGLRLFGLGWDSGHLFHPDERHIIMTANTLGLPLPPDWKLLFSPESPLNPHFFAYGSFPFYLLKLVAHLIASHGWWLPGMEGLRVWSDFDHLRELGRYLSVLFDTGSVVLVFLLGRRLYNRWAGLLAAAILSMTVLNVQLSHFFAFDTIVTFFMLAATLAALNLAERPAIGRALSLGLWVGLALATKVSAAPILAGVGAALLIAMLSRNREGQDEYEVRLMAREAGGVEVQVLSQEPGVLDLRKPRLEDIHRTVGLGLVVLLTIIAVFVVTEPYALIDSATFARNMAEQSGMVNGSNDLPYTRQYANTPPYWYQVQNILAWGMGWPLGLVAIVGTLAMLLRFFRRPLQGEAIILAWAVPYFVITGGFHTKFLRYLLPLMPLLCLFAAYGLVALWTAWRRQPRSQLVPALSSAEEGAGPLDLHWAQQLGLDWEEAAPPPSAGLRQRLGNWGGQVVAGGWAQRVAGGVICLVVIWALLYSLAFDRIYAVEHTGVQASRWMYANIPDGSRLAKEHWEEGLPVNVNIDGKNHSIDSHRYQIQELRLYEDDNARKFDHIYQTLSGSDYIIFFSNRLYATIPRLPQRYPITTRYYQLLFSQQLGYELAAAFADYPNLLGVTLMDDTFRDAGLEPPPGLAGYQPSPFSINNGKADESFTVYDHPKVMIFKKTRTLSRQEMEGLFAGTLPVGGADVSRPQGLLMSADRAQVQAAGGTFSQMFQPNSVANRLPWLVWIVMLEALGLLAFPVAFVAFRFLPDRGYLLAKTLGVLLVTWASWMMVSLGLLPAARFTVVIAVGMVGLLGIYLARRYSAELQDFWRENGLTIAASEAAFWLAFLFFLAIRLANPDLWHPARGGEKPMDLAYLMAAIKSTQFPPYDPWFAGGYLNYYYYGQVMVGTLVKFSGVVPTMAYNLAVPALYALTVGGAFSLAYNLGHGFFAAGGRRRTGPLLCGALSAILLALIGNLATSAQVVEALWRNAGPLEVRSTLPGVEGAVRAGAGLWATFILGRPFPVPTDWYWATSRVYSGPAVVNEFPYFTFLYADLHAHMIAMPFALLALGVAANALLSRATRSHVARGSGAGGERGVRPAWWQSWWRRIGGERLLGVLVAALAIGILAPINSWDFPTYLAVFGLALLISRYADVSGRGGLGGQRMWRALVGAAVQFGTVAALGYLLYYPFHSTFKSFYFGLDPVPERSEPIRYLAIHGLFLFVLLTYLGLELWRVYRRTGPLRLARLFLARWERLPRLLSLYGLLARGDDASRSEWGRLALYLALAGIAVFLALWWLGMQLIAILLVLLVPTLVLLLRPQGAREEKLVLGVLALGFAIGIFCDIFAIKGDVGRMNTVFKFYLQVWIMWAVAAGVALPRVWDAVSAWQSRHWSYAWRGGLALLLAVSLVYPIVATRARVADRFDNSIGPTLDGTAYAARAEYQDNNRRLDLAGDMEAVRWMQENIPGSPVILEATVPIYRWGSRFSIYTGLPAVLGWDWHQKQQRWGYQWMVDQRANDVRQMYTDPAPDRAMALLQQYGVKYIVVGELERAYYSGPGLDKFDRMVGSQLDVVYDRGTVKIYSVRGDA